MMENVVLSLDPRKTPASIRNAFGYYAAVAGGGVFGRVVEILEAYDEIRLTIEPSEAARNGLMWRIPQEWMLDADS